MQDIHLSLLTRKLPRDSARAEKLLQTIFAAHPDLVPRRYGNHEPLPFKVEGIPDLPGMMQCWGQNFFWSQGRRAQGMVWFEGPREHALIYISCTASRVTPLILAGLLRELSQSLNADFGSVYLEYETGAERTKRHRGLLPMVVTTVDLTRSIPELPWVAVFGPPYTNLLTQSRLASCPAYISTAISQDSWFLQLTESPISARTNPQDYEDVRDAAKAHLGLEHFMDLDNPEVVRTTPSFEWARTVRNHPIGYPPSPYNPN